MRKLVQLHQSCDNHKLLKKLWMHRAQSLCYSQSGDVTPTCSRIILFRSPDYQQRLTDRN